MTLIEVMMAITIIAILLVLGLPSLQHWLKNARIRTAAEETLAGIQLARSEAVRRNCNSEFVLGAGGGWTVQALCAGVIQTRPAVAAVGTVVVTPTPAVATTVTFNALGHRVANADRSVTLTNILIDLPTSVLAAVDTRELQIDIVMNGQIHLCDPNVGGADIRNCN